jgi:hypothetical protein
MNTAAGGGGVVVYKRHRTSGNAKEPIDISQFRFRSLDSRSTHICAHSIYKIMIIHPSFCTSTRLRAVTYLIITYLRVRLSSFVSKYIYIYMCVCVCVCVCTYICCFCIVCTVFLYCFVYVYLFLFVLSELV